MSTELLPGIVEAMVQGRKDDALALAEAVLDDLEPAAALIGMASLAQILHQHPNMSVRTVAVIMQFVDEDAEVEVEEKSLRAVAAELLSVVETRAANGGEDTPESEALLKRFDYYPGSAALAGTNASMVETLLDAVALQHAYKAVVGDGLFDRDPGQINAAAIRYTSAVLTSEDAASLPAPFNSVWG